MRLVLDTHVFIWLVADDTSLGPAARDAIAEAQRVFVSSASAWEIAIKRSLGKLDFPRGMQAVVEEAGLEELPISVRHADATDHVELPHRDPFDALLAAQCLCEQATLVTADRILLGALPMTSMDASR